MSGFDNSNDDFWDVSRLVPKKKPIMMQFSTSVKTSDVEIKSVKEESVSVPSEERALNFEKSREHISEPGKSDRSYRPSNLRLVERVTIKPSIDRFDFYDTFRKAALIYYDYKCPRCEFTPFYSYKPQYSQMTTQQKKYYFFWRDELRSGRFVKTDNSYVYLYVYEILNLPEKIAPEEGLKLLINVWKAYRNELQGLDANFSVWVQDYCLVYGLDCPFDEIKDFLFDVITVSQFKEFYLSSLDKGGNGASAMIAYLSDYDWRKCKYAGGDNAQMYRMHVEGAMQRIFARLLCDDVIKKGGVSRISRTAFPGSLCTHSVKCILEVDYYPISASPELRCAVTSALKYTENKLRALLGVKSRLAIKDLPDELKSVIDRYFAVEFERLKRQKERENAPEYEKQYYAEDTRLSFADAIEIEKASWNVTAKLVEGSSEYEDDIVQTESYKALDVESRAFVDDGEESATVPYAAEKDRYGLSAHELEYLSALIGNDREKCTEICKTNGVLADSVVDRINETFADNFGDVIIEESDDGFVVIDDYYEEITEWLQ